MDARSAKVDVICVCSADGEIRPLRLQFQDDSQQLFRVNIHEVVSKTEIQYVGVEALVFLCRAWVADREWLFELKYSIRNHSWHLMRKVY